METGKPPAVRSASEEYAKKVLEEINDKVQSKGWTLTKALRTTNIDEGLLGKEDATISSRITYKKINGKGPITPVTDFKTMLEILRKLAPEIEGQIK